MKIKSRRFDIKKVLAILLVIIFLLGALGYFYVSKKDSNSELSSSTEPDINYSSPTENEQAAANSQKEENVKQSEEDSSSSSSSNNTANVVITFAEQNGNTVEVNAYSDHYEDGTCVFTFTKDQLKIIKQTSAYRDASTTICTNPLISRSEFAKGGDWQVQVLYNSSSFSGQSKPQTIAIN